MDGYELALHLRQQSQTRNAALIAFSGFGDEDAKQRARDAGIDHYLVKPVSIADITAAVDHVAAGDRASS
jgi:CheY-like chemotaxis protein